MEIEGHGDKPRGARKRQTKRYIERGRKQGRGERWERGRWRRRMREKHTKRRKVNSDTVRRRGQCIEKTATRGETSLSSIKQEEEEEEERKTDISQRPST